MRLHRLLGIIMLLNSHKTITAENLAKILETSKRSIYRDINILCEARFPIMSVPGPKGGYSFMQGYKINSGTLKNGDILNILLSSMGVSPGKNTETYSELKNTLIKLENTVPKEYREEIIKAKEKFFIDSNPWYGERSQNKYVDTIKNAVLDLKKLKICYKKYYGETSMRVVRPYGVVVKDSEWYMAAFCEVRNDIRIFKCSRIESVEVLNDSFCMPENFDLEKFWEDSKENFSKQMFKVSHGMYPVKIKFFDEKRSLLEGFKIIEMCKMRNYWVYNVDMISFETALSIIFPLSDKIEILEPLELKDYIIKKANKIINLYKSL